MGRKPFLVLAPCVWRVQNFFTRISNTKLLLHVRITYGSFESFGLLMQGAVAWVSIYQSHFDAALVYVCIELSAA